MSWRFVNKMLKPASSIVNRLTILYTLSMVGLLITIALIFFPSLARIFSQYNAHDYAHLTIECIKQLILMILFLSISGVAVGFMISRRSLRVIHLLQNKIEQISVDALDERLNIDTWPIELKAVGEQFNHMLDRMNNIFKQLEQFSSDIAHELRHPLQHLQQMTELALTQHNLSQNEQDMYVAYMDEFQKLSTLVEQLFFLARKEQSQIKLNKEEINLPLFMHKIFEYYQAWALEKNIKLSCRGESLLVADTILIQRAFSNILANALQYTADGGHIEVIISQSDQHIVIEFSDDGIGIAAEHLPKLFQRCYQADAARSKQSSLGLGLTIVQSIVELHEATITVQSTYGQGTTITLMFPK